MVSQCAAISANYIINVFEFYLIEKFASMNIKWVFWWFVGVGGDIKD